MYKVFFNDREITVLQKTDITLNKSTENIENLHSTSDVKHWFLDFVSKHKKEANVICEDTEKFWVKVFVPSFKLIKAAGGVVKRNEQLLFIFRNKKWDLPKGKIDKGESVEKAAIREVQEECGISGHSILKKLPATYHIYQSPYLKSKGKWILKETFWFEMEYNGNENGRPQNEENITEIRWFDRSELNEVLTNTYENLKQVIQYYFD